MATLVATDAVIYCGAYDLTSNTSEVTADAEADEVECTTFASAGYREYKGGLVKSSLKLTTFYDAALAESVLIPAIGLTDNIVTVAPTATANTRAHFAKDLVSKAEAAFKVGDMAMLNAGGVSNAAPGLVGGYLILPKTTSTATTDGTAYQNGAVASTKSVYAALHVFSVSGTDTPTLTVKLQSDNDSGMGSATDRIEFTAATAIGSEFKSTAGAITDDYWRVSWTISGTNPSFSFAVVMGIK